MRVRRLQRSGRGIAMQKAYSRIDWENYPSEKTPVNETNLNKMDAALNEVDNRLISMDAEKAGMIDINNMIADVDFNEETGAFTFTKKNGAVIVVDTKLEKLVTNWDYDQSTEKMIITLEDGTVKEVNLSALITVYEFIDSDTIAFSINAEGKVSASVKNGSITADKLQPDYLANITVQAENAAASASSAGTSALTAQSYAVGNTGTRENESVDNAKHYCEQAKQISQGINGIVPMGTVSFAELPTENIVKNAMYNVSDAFTSDERFNDGGGIYYGPGNNVVWTAEGKWDVTASSSVTGIKGQAEESYRQGNVNITAENVGALPKDGTAVNAEKISGYSIVVLSESDYQNLPAKDEKTFYCRPKE